MKKEPHTVQFIVQGHKTAAKAESRPKPFVANNCWSEKKGRNSDTHSVRTLTKSLLLRLA